MHIDDSRFRTLPAAHNNIGHALDSIKMCKEFKPQRLLLELPYELQSLAAAITKAVKRLGPTPGAVFIPRGAVRMPVPDPAEPEVLSEREVLLGDCIPVGADSITITLWMTGQVRRWRPRIVFADCRDGEPPPAPDPTGATDFSRIDAAEVERLGTTAFYAKWRNHFLCNLQPSVANAKRETCMAWHAREALRSMDTTVLVNGAAHEDPIRRRILTDDIPDVLGQAPALKSSIRVVAVPPAAAFGCLHWMQDIPYITSRFWQNILAGQYDFDRDTAMLAMFAEANERAGRPIAPRGMLNLVRSIYKATATYGRWRVPLDILAGRIKAFAGKGFTDFLINEVALSYPIPGARDVPEVDVLPAPPLGNFLFNFERDEVYLIPDTPGRSESRERMLLYVRRDRLRGSAISKEEASSNGLLNWRIKAPEEERASKWLNAYARNLAHRKVLDNSLPRRPNRTESQVVLSRLDLHRTHRARLQGDKTGYYERQACLPEHKHVPCPYCASVFLLQSPGVHTSRTSGFFVNPVKDYHANPRRQFGNVYAAFYWFAERRALPHDLRESHISMVLRLLPDVVPSTDETAVAAMLASVPPQKRCDTPVWDDRELIARFKSPVELAMAGAIRWTMADHILVVGAECGGGIPLGVQAYAKEKKVDILTLRRDEFPSLVLERGALDTEMPAASPFSGPPASLSRFVTPLWGYPEPMAGVSSIPPHHHTTGG